MVERLHKSRVAITGAGWVTPLGRDIERTWEGLLLGRDAFVQMPSPYRLRNGLCAVVPDVPYSLPASERLFAMTADAARAALSSAGVAGDDERIVTVIGTSFGDSLDDPEPESFARLAARLEHELGLRRPPVFISTACSSGSDALAVGFDLIGSGEAEICLCGGADVLTDIKRLAHSSLGTMSPTRLRPFDMRHDGTLLGEGAGFVVLKRARAGDDHGVIGWFLGYGAANDAATMTAPDLNATGGRQAVERALVSARLEASDVAAFCAHGSGTVLNDDGEKEILNTTFRGSGVLVFATKGALGHSLGATGAIELIALLLALRDGVAPPIAGLEQRDATLSVATASGRAAPFGGTTGLSLTLGFGGFDTCLAVSAGG